MQQREKTLLAVLLGAVGFTVVFPVLEGVLLSPFQSRRARVADLQNTVDTKTEKATQLDEIERQLIFWSVESLPPEQLIAQRVYTEWLVDVARLSGLRDVEPQINTPSGAAGVYTTIPVTVHAEATLSELATFLFHFERTRLLHRIAKCDVTSPDTEGNPLLKVTIAAEGLSLPDAPVRSRLFPRTALQRPLAAGDTTLQVESSGTFPADGPLRVRVGPEFLSVTRRQGENWTVERGVDSTTPVDHPVGAFVEYTPVAFDATGDRPESIDAYVRLLEGGPFVKPRPPIQYNPTLAPIANQTLFRGNTLTTQARVSSWDPGHGPAVYALDDTSPASMRIDSDGQITWTPGDDAPADTYPVGVVVTARDKPDLQLTTSFEVTLKDPNLPPRLSVPSSIPIAYIGRGWRLSLNAQDPDQTGGLTFSLASGAPEGLNIDPRTGELRWALPETIEPGETSITVQVTDNGDPPQSATANLTVPVEDDNAQFTYLVGCLRDGDRWTAWLYDRSTNRSQYLQIGDRFQVADISGTIAAIDLTSMEFEDESYRWRLPQEQSLRDAERRTALTSAPIEPGIADEADESLPSDEPSDADNSPTEEDADEPSADR